LNGRAGGPPQTLATFKDAAQRRFGELSEGYFKLYPAASDEDSRQMAHRACAEEVSWNMRQFAAAAGRQGQEGLQPTTSRGSKP
jgi:hypothetical protein